jgi:hypothetical protein
MGWRRRTRHAGEPGSTPPDRTRVVFTGRAAEAFHGHEVEGVYSGLKRLVGQHKAGFGDLMWNPRDAVRIGDTLYVSEVQLAMHAGQTEAQAALRLWGRRFGLDAPLTAGTIYVGYEAIDATGVLEPEGTR